MPRAARRARPCCLAPTSINCPRSRPTKRCGSCPASRCSDDRPRAPSNPTTHGVTMRGLSASGSSRGLVLLDGVPLNDGFGGWVTWTRLPPDAISRVDVDRGAEGEAVRIRCARRRDPHRHAGLRQYDASMRRRRRHAGRRRSGRRRRRPDRPGGGVWIRQLVSHGRRDSRRAGVARARRSCPANATWSNALGRVVFGQGSRPPHGGRLGRLGRPRQRHGDPAQPHERRHRRGRVRSDQRSDDVCRPPLCESEPLLSDVLDGRRGARDRNAHVDAVRPTARRRAAWSRPAAASPAARYRAS